MTKASPIDNYSVFVAAKNKVNLAQIEDINMTYDEASDYFTKLRREHNHSIDRELSIFTCFSIVHFLDSLFTPKVASAILTNMIYRESMIDCGFTFICGYFSKNIKYNEEKDREYHHFFPPTLNDMSQEEYIDNLEKAFFLRKGKLHTKECVLDVHEINIDNYMQASFDFKQMTGGNYSSFILNIILRTLEETELSHYINDSLFSEAEYKDQCIRRFKDVMEEIKVAEYTITSKYRNIFINEIKIIKIQHLDKGYVKFINHMGDDVFSARFARSSYDKTDRVDMKADKNLIERLVSDRHTSPIESCRMAFEIKTCLMVRDQHVRHRMSSMNVQSLRYTKHDGDFYTPPVKRIKIQSKTNKQGSGSQMSEEDSNKIINDLMTKPLEESYKYYQTMTDMGLTRELARGILGTFFFTKISWTIDTHNLMNFLKLRNSEEAQEEIRELAKIIELYFKFLYPFLFEAYDEHIKNSVTFSRTESQILKDIITHFITPAYYKEFRAMEDNNFESKLVFDEFATSKIMEVNTLYSSQFRGENNKPTTKLKKFMRKIGFPID